MAASSPKTKVPKARLPCTKVLETPERGPLLCKKDPKGGRRQPFEKKKASDKCCIEPKRQPKLGKRGGRGVARLPRAIWGEKREKERQDGFCRNPKDCLKGKEAWPC